MNQFSNKKLIVANWKMAPSTWAEAEQILDFINDNFESRTRQRHAASPRGLVRDESGNEKETSLVICPPFVFLEEVGKVLKTSHLEHETELGAQDIAFDDSTALTGLGEGSRVEPGISVEVSSPMLQKLGVRYVIVGHSERRWKLGESDEVVNKKLKAVLRNEMTPIVCLGEKIRDENFKEFLKEQVGKTFADLSQDELKRCIIAYEPVWAISTNPDARPDTPKSATESISIIQEYLNSKFKIQNSKFLYGGSVTSKNVAEFIEQKEIDGVLVGAASVNKEEFIKILKIADKLLGSVLN